MIEARVHGAAVWAVIGLAVLTFAYLLRRAAPYGRHYAAAGRGPHLANRLGWVVMELPATAVFLIVHAQGPAAGQAAPLVLLAMWQAHYLHRTFVYSLRTRTSGRRIPVWVVGAGFLFNSLNAYINARFISAFGAYDANWLGDPRFLAGATIFLLGMILNIRSDNRLLGLRDRGGGDYAIPTGGAFRYVSCPNYLGEIIQWAGWALAAWSLAGFAFFLYTAANLVPRARSHHAWYRARFADYPPNRKALIPGVF